MAYYSEEQLLKIGFKHVGSNVKISDKASIYDAEEIEIGDHSRIDDFCVISGKVSIGNYCHITPMCLVAGGKLGVLISDFSSLAYGVKVFSQSDDYTGESMVNSLIPKKYKSEIFDKVRIERHVVVGANAVILPGVTVREGCAIGASALLLKSTDAWGIYAGVPASRIKERSKKILELEAKFLEEGFHDSI
ncbi:acyltransferase [Franzmannia qiaohouensis]|uniref:Chloramphenicol acetyltransferase n=1 Tax=Franzmannia qiaohouensis TaxID=1329370 RepID=A0ABU1HKC1_9GAMM|nr:acyltransferase [Halomonas qiaohouensis]MDR5907493.1 acyltransferase [Halomonas qiaohouensis]